jgi:hypothetical protein
MLEILGLPQPRERITEGRHFFFESRYIEFMIVTHELLLLYVVCFTRFDGSARDMPMSGFSRIEVIPRLS